MEPPPGYVPMHLDRGKQEKTSELSSKPKEIIYDPFLTSDQSPPSMTLHFQPKEYCDFDLCNLHSTGVRSPGHSLPVPLDGTIHQSSSQSFSTATQGLVFGSASLFFFNTRSYFTLKKVFSDHARKLPLVECT